MPGNKRGRSDMYSSQFKDAPSKISTSQSYEKAKPSKDTINQAENINPDTRNHYMPSSNCDTFLLLIKQLIKKTNMNSIP